MSPDRSLPMDEEHLTATVQAILWALLDPEAHVDLLEARGEIVAAAKQYAAHEIEACLHPVWQPARRGTGQARSGGKAATG